MFNLGSQVSDASFGSRVYTLISPGKYLKCQVTNGVMDSLGPPCIRKVEIKTHLRKEGNFILRQSEPCIYRIPRSIIGPLALKDCDFNHLKTECSISQNHVITTCPPLCNSLAKSDKNKQSCGFYRSDQFRCFS